MSRTTSTAPTSADHPAYRSDCRRCGWHGKPCRTHRAEYAEAELLKERKAHTATRRALAAAEAELARLKGGAQ